MKASRQQDHRTNQARFRAKRSRLSRRIKAHIDRHIEDVMAGRARFKKPSQLAAEVWAEHVVEELLR